MTVVSSSSSIDDKGHPVMIAGRRVLNISPDEGRYGAAACSPPFAKYTIQKNVKKTIKPTFFKHRKEGHAIATNTHTHTHTHTHIQPATTAAVTTTTTTTWATAFHRLQVPTISQNKAKNTRRCFLFSASSFPQPPSFLMVFYIQTSCRRCLLLILFLPHAHTHSNVNAWVRNESNCSKIHLKI